MRTGKMIYRVTLQKPIGEDTRRGMPQVYEDVATVWASIRPSKSIEKTDNKRTVAIGIYEIRIWTHNELDPTCRIKHGDQLYNIVQIDEPDPIRKETIILAHRDKINAH